MIKNLSEKLGNKLPEIKDITFQGYPGKKFSVDADEMLGEIRIFLRSNRAYFITGIFPKKQEADLEKFFNSFKFLPYTPTALSEQKIGKELKLDLPSKPVFDKETSDGLDNGAEVYSSQDPNTGDSYAILITPHSKYDQYESDSVYLEERISAFRSVNAEQNQERFLTLDGVLAKELLVTQRKHLTQRYVAFARGHIGYLLLTTVHPLHVKNATSEKFFNSAKFEGKPNGDLYADKSSIVLKDLVNPDTTIANPAKEAMPNMSFTEKNFDEITTYLEKKYPDDADFTNSRKEHLLDALNSLESEKSVAFVEKIFPTLNKNSILEFTAISTVAAIKTRAALDARIRLIAKHTPHEEIIYHPILGFYTVDSADQKYFYEKTNYLLTTNAFKLSLYYFMKQLMEQKRLTLKEIAPWRTAINTNFEYEVSTFKKDSTFKNLDDFMIIMKHFDVLDKKHTSMLKELSASHNTYLGILASTTLLKHKLSVAPSVLLSFAKDNYDRLTLFDELEKESLLQHFPKAYLNQDSLAVSQAYTYMRDEDIAAGKVEIAYQGLEEFQGGKMKFYVMRVYDNDNDIWYRGIIGPFDPKKLATWGEMNYFDSQDPEEDYKQFLIDSISQTTSDDE
jgi:hypothetical protein